MAPQPVIPGIPPATRLRTALAVGLPFLLGATLLAHGFLRVYWEPDLPETSIGHRAMLLERRSEEWLGLPLVYHADFQQQDAIRRFIEEKEGFKKELTEMASAHPPIPAATPALEAIGPIVEAQSQLMGAMLTDKETVAHEYVTRSDVYRNALAEVTREARAIDDARQAQILWDHKLGAWTLGGGLALLFASAVGAGLSLRAWLSSRFGAFVKIAEQQGAVEPQVIERQTAAGDALVAVHALAVQLAEQRLTTQDQIKSQDMLREFTEALETVDDEEEIVLLFLRCLSLRHPRLRCQLLLADPSEEELRPVVEEDDEDCACAPLKPNRCKAMRLGRALRVDQPASIASCPRMQQNKPLPYGCVPLNIAGRSAAVLRMVSAEPGEVVTIAEVTDAAAVAQRFAIRVGVQRLLTTTARQARTDALTGLPNRRVGVDQLDRMLARVRSGESGMVAVLGLDLDHFKKLNDTYGHAAGDAALRSSVAAAKTVLPEGAVFARIGGEEFMICVPVKKPREAMNLADSVVVAIRALVKEGGAPSTTVSIGVALAPDDGLDHQATMRVADDRLYMAKNTGRDRAVGPDEAARILAAAPTETGASVVTLPVPTEVASH